MKKYTVLLFQPYIRSFVTNFGPYLKRSSFVVSHQQEETKQLYKRLTTFSEETSRTKTNWLQKFRRILGVPSIRIKFTRKADLLFSYGTLIISNKPYCAYVETGLAPYGYDRKIANHPVAQQLVSFLLRRKNCKKIIFISKTSMQSFASSVPYSPRTMRAFEKKSTYCYPLMEAQDVKPKIPSKTLKFLFAGTFYIKGGMGTVHAFLQLRKRYKDRVHLTIITSTSILKPEDLKWLHSLDGVTIHNATFSKQEMHNFYRTHDVFVMPTYRDGFGLVWIEAISFGLPIIGTDQYATSEMGIHNYNALLYPNHPLKDYDTDTYKVLGKYHDPKDFYKKLFTLQKLGKMKDIEKFLLDSMEGFVKSPDLLRRYSQNSLSLYQERFHQQKIARRMDQILVDAVENI